MKRLTPKQEAFAFAYARGATQVVAYVRTYAVRQGRPTSNVRQEASELARKPHVAARIEELRRELRAKADAMILPTPAQLAAISAEKDAAAAKQHAEAAIERSAIDKAMLEAHLVTIIDKGIADVPVYDKDSNVIGYRTVNLGAACRAIELLGKERGMFGDGRKPAEDPLDQLTHAEVRRLKDLIEEVRQERAEHVNH